jgi:hypothetical protein
LLVIASTPRAMGIVGRHGSIGRSPPGLPKDGVIPKEP